MSNQIEELSSRLKKARETYFNLDPIMTDIEYDTLKDELRKLDPFNEEVIAIGFPAPKDGVWSKVAHEIPMGSLNKANSATEFKEWVSKTGSEKFLITHKIDGSSLEVIYDNGYIISAVSRGDGNIGDELITNAIKIPNLPKRISSKEHLVVRGEIVMLKETFETKYAQEYANPRNTAAGKIRDQKGKGEACKDLSFIAYTIIGLDLKNEDQQFQKLKKLGFEIPQYLIGGVDDMCNYFTSITGIRNNIPYEIDGQVVRVFDLKLQEQLGEKNMRPEGQIAWKFDSLMKESKILDVIWQIGNNGRTTPVAIIEPTQIGGVVVHSVSLHNLSLFRDLRLFKNARILISRRNDVIPYVEAVLDDI